jgi:type VI secretion system secreted protein VgrG
MDAPDTQTPLFASVTLPGQDGVVQLHTISSVERLSRPFRYDLEASIDSLDIDKARGTEAYVHLTDEIGNERHVWGVIDSIEVKGDSVLQEDEAARYHLSLVPMPFMLSYRFGSRIFLDLSVPDIIDKVFQDAKIPTKYLVDNVTRANYTPRSLCVQYDESEWDFICRLMESEGIWFTFEHDGTGHRMVLRDKNDGAPKSTPPDVPFVADPRLHGNDVRFWDWSNEARASVTKVVLDDYDGLRPSRVCLVDVSATGADLIQRTSFEYPGRYHQAVQGKPIAQLRLDEQRTQRHTGAGMTNALSLRPGQLVNLQDHPGANGPHLVTSVSFHLDLDAGSDDHTVNALQFSTLAQTTRFRPARLTPRPRIFGVQTARVEGPAGEEVHCDEHGRVRLRFNWDREAQRGEKTSSWIRVAQNHTTGSISVPRVGWEVLVSFIDGDPDQPIVQGRLFNPMFGPDYDLPAQKTVTALRSNSSPGSDAAHEVCMDDAAGAERIFVNSPRVITVVAQHKKKHHVQGEESRIVTNKRSLKVGANDKLVVGGLKNAQVSKDQVVKAATRKLAVTGAAVEEVKGDDTLTVGAIESMKVGSAMGALLEVVAALVMEKAADAGKFMGKKAGRFLTSKLPLKQAKFVLKKARKVTKLAEKFEKLNKKLEKAKSAAEGASYVVDADKLLKPYEDKFNHKYKDQIAAYKKASKEADDLKLDKLTGQAETALANRSGSDQLKTAVANATKPAGGEGGDAGGPSAAGNAAGGNGTWGTTVKGNVDEKIGAIALMTGIASLNIGVGKDSKESIGGARIELIEGEKKESAATKKELVGMYVALLDEGLSIDASAAMALNTATETQNIKGGHALNAGPAAALTAAKMTFEADDQVTLTCGTASVVIDSSGVNIKGAASITIEGTSKLTVEPAAITPGA